MTKITCRELLLQLIEGKVSEVHIDVSLVTYWSQQILFELVSTMVLLVLQLLRYRVINKFQN